MAQKTLVIIHTGPVTVQPLNALAPALLPDVRVVNLVDDSLLKDAMAAGHVTPAVSRRLTQYMMIGQEMGADLILNACSSVREAADIGARLLSVPVAKIDTAWRTMPWPRRAVSVSPPRCRPRSIRPCALIEQTALAAGKSVTVTPQALRGCLRGSSCR